MLGASGIADSGPNTTGPGKTFQPDATGDRDSRAPAAGGLHSMESDESYEKTTAVFCDVFRLTNAASPDTVASTEL